MVKHWIQHCFQLIIGSSCTSNINVWRSVAWWVVSNVTNHTYQTIHSTERLTVAEALRFLTKEDCLLNVRSVESCAILAVLCRSAITCDNLSCVCRARNTPSIPEDLSQVSDSNWIDAQSLRTDRSFFICVTNLVSFWRNTTTDSYGSCSSSTNTTTYRNGSWRKNSVDNHVLFGLEQLVNLARKQVLGRDNSENSCSVGDRSSQSKGGEHHGFGEETVFNLQSSASAEQSS